MKAKGVDDWLRHWVKVQKKDKRPLILKDPSKPQSDPTVQPGKNPKGKRKQKDAEVDSDIEEQAKPHPKFHGGTDPKEKRKQKDNRKDSDDDDQDLSERRVRAGQDPKGKRKHQDAPVDSDNEEQNEESGIDCRNGEHAGPVENDASGLPPAPFTSARSKETRYKFLLSLSEDKHYRQLIRLLLAAKVRIYNPSYT